MDLTLLTSLSSEYKKPWTGTRFTVRSANSPSYSLVRRKGVSDSIFYPGEKSSGETGERERCGTRTTNEGDTVQARTGSRSSIKGQCSIKDRSPRLDQHDTENTPITKSGTDESENTAFKSCGRMEKRKYNLSSRSLRAVPYFSTKADMSMFSFKDEKRPGEVEEGRTGVENVRGRGMPSVQSSTGVGHVQERSPVSPLSHTLDKTSRGYSLPSRLRSNSKSDSRFTETSCGPKGGQSIQERIEKLYGPASFGKTEDYSKIRDSSFPASPPDFSWIPNNSLSAEKSRRLSGGQETQSRHSEGGGDNWSKGLEEIGTRSLDRTRSRNAVAAQIRSAKAAGEFTARPKSNLFLQEGSVIFKDSSGLRNSRSSGCFDQSRGNHREEKGETERPSRVKETQNEAKGKSDWRSVSTDEDVFESNSQNNTLKTTERRNRFPNIVAVPSAASVRNKINQFEALSQRALSGSQGLPRRALSEPAPLSIPHDRGKSKIRGGLRDKWEEEKVDESEEMVGKAGKNLWSVRSLSVDGVGLMLGKKERDEKDVFENKTSEIGSGNNRGEDFDKYNKLRSTLKLPLNEGSQRRLNFYIDETDFCKVSSPEDTNKSDNVTPFLLLSSDTSAGVQKPTPSGLTSPASSEDRTPTNTPNHSPFLSPTIPLKISTPKANGCDPTALPHPLATSSYSNPDLISPDVNTPHKKGKKRVMDLNAWIAGLNSDINVWTDEDEDYDDDESTQKDEDSNYDSDSGESSVTVTSNVSQSDHKSFCVRFVVYTIRFLV